VLKLIAATLSVACLSACTALTGGGQSAPVNSVSILRSHACYIRNTFGEIWQVPCEGAVQTATACYVSNGPWNLQEVACPRGMLRAVARRRTRMREE
jgi:hypothetical protein